MKKILYWFRQDLRLTDNPALLEAVKSGIVMPIYILDDINAGDFALGGASRWWLHHSLISLDKSLKHNMQFFRGNPIDIIYELVKKHSIDEVYWNRCYEPWQTNRDKLIKQKLKDNNISAKSYNGSLLWEPWEVLKDDGTPYKVFTPFYRKCCTDSPEPRTPTARVDDITFYKTENYTDINDLGLIKNASWADKFNSIWDIGEEAAIRQFEKFKANGLSDYKLGRNFPAKSNVSRLSPHLHFGEISPNYIWHNCYNLSGDNNIDTFRSELGWREFSYYLLFNNPEMPLKNLKSAFDNLPWDTQSNHLQQWQKGQTGIPIVDAGMRELWQTGYMHNRVRMIVGSFLVKNLMIDWRCGEKWFWDCLLDADLASNSASWQWVAGSGCDAAPFFRIFNPVTQGQKFDPDGKYTKRYIPELQNLDSKYLFNPWEAPSYVLQQAGIIIGKTYPQPIVDLKESRIRALDAFKSLNSN